MAASVPECPVGASSPEVGVVPTPPLSEQVYRSLRRLSPPVQPTPKRWRSVLILRPCCIGDILQSTALVGVLRRALPDVHLGYAVGPWSRPVLANNPNLDEIVDTGTVVGGRKPSPSGFASLIRRLRRGRWDACFVLERSPLFGLAARMAGIPDRIGLDNGGRGFALSWRVPLRPRRQEAEAVLDLARAVSLDVSDARTEFYPGNLDLREVERLALPDDRPWVCLAPGGGVNPGTELIAKRWEAERFGALAGRLANRGYLPLLIGGPPDRQAVEAALAAGDGSAINLCERLSLTAVGALLQRSRLLVSNDTGVLHLAAAVDTPVVGLFGPTDPALYAPYRVRQRIIWHPRTCSPCFRQRQRPPDCLLDCMKTIGVDEVEAAALDLLS